MYYSVILIRFWVEQLSSFHKQQFCKIQKYFTESVYVVTCIHISHVRVQHQTCDCCDI